MLFRSKQWLRLQTYWDNNPEKFAEFYSRIDDSMLAEGGIFEGLTREEALFKYERISTWNLTNHRETLEKLDTFFRDCDGSAELVFTEQDKNVINDVMDNGSIRNVEGSSNVRVTARLGNDCGTESTLSTEKITTSSIQTTATTVDTPTQPAAEVPPTQFTQLEDVNRYENTSQLNASLYKSNNLYNGELVKDNLSAEDPLVNAVNKEVMIENSGISATDTNISTDVASNNITDGASTGNDNSIFTRKDDIIIDNTISAEDNSLESNTLFTQKDDIIVDNTVDVDASEVSNNSSENVNSETSAEGTTDNIATKSEIIEGIDNVEEGTPAAGNIEARGGYENSGITQKQYERMQTFFKNSYGENAYEDFASRITDDMRAKGGIFEGLSVEQSMYSIQQMIAWSDDQTGKFATEITNIVNYLKDCDDAISVTYDQDIKAVIDSVNENGTIDGVTGTKPVIVRYFQANDCGEAGTYGLEAGTDGVTNPGGDGFTRLFRRTWTETPEPVFTHAETVNIYTQNQEPINVSLNKGNGLVFGEEIKTVDATEAIVDAKNVKIRIENTGR